MPKYLLSVQFNEYWEYVIEADSKEEAFLRALEDVTNSLDIIEPTIKVEEVGDDTPLGDA